MECKDVEWAAFLFNSMGEDWAYIDQLRQLKDNIKKDKQVGEVILKFLNKWRSRAPEEVGGKIEIWYNENHRKLNELSFCLIDADFDDKTTADEIKDIYRSLLGENGNGIGDTIASKTLHILKPDLFVPWDGPIKAWYDSQLNQEDDKKTGQEDKYLAFLKKMQKEAKHLVGQKENFLSELNSNVQRLYEGNLEQVNNIKKTNDKSKSTKTDKKSDDEKIDYNVMVNFMKTTGKTLAKYLDEYNWITITNTVKIRPEWHPD